MILFHRLRVRQLGCRLRFAFPTRRWGLLNDGIVQITLHLRMHCLLIAFEGQHVVGIRFDDFLGDGLLATHGIDRDDAAGQFEHAQQLGQRGDLVALLGHFELAQHQPVALRPGADDVAGRLPPAQRPAQRLAVQGDDLLGHGLAQALRPAQEAVQERRRFQGGKDTIEGVVGRDAVAEREKGPEPLVLGATEVGHVVEAGAPAEQGADGDDQHVGQVVIAAALDARVGQVLEMFKQAEFGMRLHPHSSIQYAQKYKRQNGAPQKNV